MDSFSRKVVRLSLLSPVILWLGFALTPNAEERAQFMDGAQACPGTGDKEARNVARASSPLKQGCETTTG